MNTLSPTQPAKPAHAAANAAAASFAALMAKLDYLSTDEVEQVRRAYRLADEALDVEHMREFFGGHDCECFADGLGTTGATDAVNVIFRMLGHIVIDHMTNAGDIDAACGNVGRDHHFIFATFEAFEGLDALRAQISLDTTAARSALGLS